MEPMKNLKPRWPWMIGFGILAAVLLGAGRKQPDQDQTPHDSWPQVDWRESFPEEIQGFDLARRTGEVVVHSDRHVWYYNAEGKLAWKMGEGKGWQYLGSAGISWDGQRVLFQSNLEPRRHTNLLNLDVYLVDGSGNLEWVKKNPYRYNTSKFSPSGRYILFGDPLEKTTKVYDQNLNLLWQKELYLWYVIFDPAEQFLFDSVTGLLFDLQGRQVWDLGGNNRVLSVSDRAEVVLAARFLGLQPASDLFLISRTALKKVPLQGSAGCVSPDGSLLAYANGDHQIVVYRTPELFSAGPELKPIFTVGFAKPLLMNLSRDNRSLFVFGQENQFQTVLMLVWLPEQKVRWKEGVQDTVQEVKVTEDNRGIVYQKDKNTLVKLRGY